jgi:hypothetical protein
MPAFLTGGLLEPFKSGATDEYVCETKSFSLGGIVDFGW